MTSNSTALATWTIDPMHSITEFSVKHMMISTVKGHFGTVSGSLKFDGTDLTSASAEAIIDASSINTNVEARDGHLKSPDFFDVENHPTLTFKSTGVTSKGGNEYEATGNLTIRGTTKPVTLEVELEGQVLDPYGKQRMGLTAHGTISRGEFGLQYNQLLETGGAVVSDKVKITLHIEATRD